MNYLQLIVPSSRRLKMLVEKPESHSRTPYESENKESPSKSEESSVILKNARSEESISEPAIDGHPDAGLEW